MIPFTYELDRDELLVKVGKLTVRRVKYENIEEIRSCGSLFCETMCNVWPLNMEYTTLRRRDAIFKDLVINPTPREEFIAELRTRLSKYGYLTHSIDSSRGRRWIIQ